MQKQLFTLLWIRSLGWTRSALRVQGSWPLCHPVGFAMFHYVPIRSDHVPMRSRKALHFGISGFSQPPSTSTYQHPHTPIWARRVPKCVPITFHAFHYVPMRSVRDVWKYLWYFYTFLHVLHTLSRCLESCATDCPHNLHVTITFLHVLPMFFNHFAFFPLRSYAFHYVPMRSVRDCWKSDVFFIRSDTFLTTVSQIVTKQVEKK